MCSFSLCGTVATPLSHNIIYYNIISSRICVFWSLWARGCVGDCHSWGQRPEGHFFIIIIDFIIFIFTIPFIRVLNSWASHRVLISEVDMNAKHMKFWIEHASWQHGLIKQCLRKKKKEVKFTFLVVDK